VSKPQQENTLNACPDVLLLRFPSGSHIERQCGATRVRGSGIYVRQTGNGDVPRREEVSLFLGCWLTFFCRMTQKFSQEDPVSWGVVPNNLCGVLGGQDNPVQHLKCGDSGGQPRCNHVTSMIINAAHTRR
jgi:hypothetical protein